MFITHVKFLLELRLMFITHVEFFLELRLMFITHVKFFLELRLMFFTDVKFLFSCLNPYISLKLLTFNYTCRSSAQRSRLNYRKLSITF